MGPGVKGDIDMSRLSRSMFLFFAPSTLYFSAVSLSPGLCIFGTELALERSRVSASCRGLLFSAVLLGMGVHVFILCSITSHC